MDGSPQRGSLHATTLWHSDAAEWAPSTASIADIERCQVDVRSTPESACCITANLDHQCPLWVKSRHSRISARCPLYPQKWTSVERVEMSAKCQKKRSAVAVHAAALRLSFGD